MAQADIQISTTPPLAGSTLVNGLNDALAALNTDFAGTVDPASFDGVGPYSTWADTLNGLLKRRNAANTAWVTEGKILANNSPDASETTAGLIEIATAAEAQAFASNKAIDGAKLASAFKGGNQDLSTVGHQKIPGGLIIQWGALAGPSSISKGSVVNVAFSFDISFPNGILSITQSLSFSTLSCGLDSVSASGGVFSLYGIEAALSPASIRYIAVGY